MTDPDIDMEELEARLYGQVHHAANEDEEPSSYRPPAAEAEPSGKRFGRYFEKKAPQAPFPSDNVQYQSPLNSNPPFFQSNHNLFNTPANFYKNFRLVPLSDLVLNPAVNNIVVFPPPPTQIFTQQNPPEWQIAKKMQNMLNKKERYLKKRREKRRRKKLEKKNIFREHYTMLPPQRTGFLESNSNEIENKVSERSDEVICLSESDSSDCEAILSEKDKSVVILSSDDESNYCKQSVAEVKCENANANVKANINNDSKPQRAIETCVDDNKRTKREPSDVASIEDDEVIFVEPAERREVITIDCEDSQTFPIEKVTVVSREIIIQERKELLDTAESTNDFLDSTLTLNKNTEDDLNTTEQRADLDTCETESSCSTNDCETPTRGAIFNEEVFDSPSKGLSELNFDSFTNYIATKATPNYIPSILTPIKSAIALRVDKSNNSRTNTSDSSSESDYEDSKSAYVDKRKQVNSQVKKKPSDSARNKKDPLPNLSPITSDEELDLADLTNGKSKSLQKTEKTSNRNKKAPLANLSLMSDEELDVADITNGKSKFPQKKETSKSSRNKKAPLANLSPITSDEELNIADLTNDKSKSSQKKEKTSKSNRNKKVPLPSLSPITSDEELNIADLTNDNSKSPQKKQKTSKSSPSKQSVEQPVKQVRAEKRKSDTRKSPEPSKKPRQSIENSTADVIQQESVKGLDSESSEDSDSMKSPELSKKPQQNVDKSPPDLIQQETVEQLDSETSESDSDIEIVPPSNLDSSNCGSDLELLNIEAGFSPINVPQEKTNTKLMRFSDYWTDDMKKFYFETWNGENFSVEEEQRKMTDDPKFWKIIARDRVNVNLQTKGPRCHRCREFGHKSHNCKKKIEPPKCILCGARGHLEARCPNKVCTSCGRRSHYSTTYCSRCTDSRYARCKICLVRGHTLSNCTDLWRCYHLTTRNGPIVQPINTNKKASRDRWCSGCASRGHFEHDCNYYNRTHPPANPFIRSYNDVSDNIDASHGLQRQKNDNRRIVFPEDNTHCNDKVFLLSAQNNTYAAQTRLGGEENYSNNTRPPMPIPLNLNSVQVYPYDQGFAPNVQQPNMYQEFPVYSPSVTPAVHQFVPPNNNNRAAYNTETMISHTEAVGDFWNNPYEGSHELNKNIFLKRRFTMQNVKQMIQFLESSHICWTQLATWYYNRVQNVQEHMKNTKDQNMKQKLESDYANLNAMILVKLQVARGAKHLKILKKWIAKNKVEGNSVSKRKKERNNVRNSFNYIFNNRSRLNINYPKIIRRFSNDKQLQLRMEINNMMNAGTQHCLSKN